METAPVVIKVQRRVKNKYLELAQERIPTPELLVNVVRRRVRQLIQGHRPLTQTDPLMEFSDIALKEIGEGKLSYELIDVAGVEPEASTGDAAPPVSPDTLAA